MLEIAGEWRFDLKILEQFAGVTRILRRDEFRFPQNTHGARREVFEIADGGGDDKERADGAHLKMRWE